jgi:O-antigen/teichoic acid export membrane protein
MGDVLAYFTPAAAIAPFWAGRFFARGHRGSAKTGLIVNALMALVFFSIYILLIPMIMSALQVTDRYHVLYLVLSLRVIEVYLNAALESIVYMRRPEALGYGSTIYETIKVAAGFILIMMFGLKLLGAILSMIIAGILKVAFYFRRAAHEFREKVNWGYVREWFKASIFNIYQMIGQSISGFTLIILFIIGGHLARAYFGAATTIASVIGYSIALSSALYPKLLQDGRPEDVSISLKMVLMFAVPMSFGAIILSYLYLVVLNPLYVDAVPILQILSLVYLCGAISSVFESVVYGMERLDEKAKIPLRSLIKSRIFKLAMLPYIHSMLVLPSLFYILTFYASSPSEAAFHLGWLNLLTGFAFMLARYKMARSCISFVFPWKSLLKYCFSSGLMAVTLYLIPIPRRLFLAIAATGLGAIIYFTVLWMIDEEMRNLVRLMLKETKTKVGL